MPGVAVAGDPGGGTVLMQGLPRYLHADRRVGPAMAPVVSAPGGFRWAVNQASS